MTNWENFCKQFSTVLREDESLSSIRLELYLAGSRSYVKVIGNLLMVILKIFLFHLKKEISPQHLNYQNVYFIDSTSPSDIENLISLLAEDKRTFLVMINSEVERSNAFAKIKEQIEYINYENYISLDPKYFLKTFSLSVLISKHMNCNFLNVFNLVLKHFSVKDALDQIISTIAVKNIFLSNDTLLPSSLATHLAKKNGIQDYILQQGFLTKFYLPITGTNYIVWGDKAREWLESKNVKINILPLGSPRLDAVVTVKANATKLKQKFYDDYQIDNNKHIFLYMSHSHAPEFKEELHQRNFESLIRVIENKNYQLIIKLHPAENTALFDKVFKPYKGKVILLPKNANLYNTIISSKVCASAYSTTLIESMCLEVPTIQMNILKEKRLPDYSVREGCISVTNAIQLDTVLEKTNFAKELDRQTKFTNLYFNNFGNASRTIHNHVSSRVV